MVKLDGSYFLGVVKTDFLDMDPLSMVVTLLISLKKNSDNLITVVCEDRNILRWGVFTKTVRFLSLLGFYFIFLRNFFLKFLFIFLRHFFRNFFFFFFSDIFFLNFYFYFFKTCFS